MGDDGPLVSVLDYFASGDAGIDEVDLRPLYGVVDGKMAEVEAAVVWEGDIKAEVAGVVAFHSHEGVIGIGRCAFVASEVCTLWFYC
jgi:hypothetical protein